jgi:predicted metal-binding protein
VSGEPRSLRRLGEDFAAVHQFGNVRLCRSLHVRLCVQCNEVSVEYHCLARFLNVLPHICVGTDSNQVMRT